MVGGLSLLDTLGASLLGLAPPALESLWRLNSLTKTIRLAIARCRDLREENFWNLSVQRSGSLLLSIVTLALRTPLRTSGSLALSVNVSSTWGYSLVS